MIIIKHALLAVRHSALLVGGILLTGGLIGCVSNPLNEAKIDFRTRITNTDLKQFEMRVRRPDNGLTPAQEALQQSRRQSRQPARTDSDLRRKERLEEQMLAKLDELIAQNRFCREGYWIITSETYGDEPYVRGECNETASPQDRDRFPDTIAYW